MTTWLWLRWHKRHGTGPMLKTVKGARRLDPRTGVAYGEPYDLTYYRCECGATLTADEATTTLPQPARTDPERTQAVEVNEPPLVSIYTPSHDATYLPQAAESVLAQTYPHWEWVVLTNNDLMGWTPPGDERIRVHQKGKVAGVGAAKKVAVAYTRGEYLVELDHDDLLHPEALAHVVGALQAHPDAALVYSDFTQVLADGSPDPTRWLTSHGWEYAPTDWPSPGHIYPVGMDPTPHNVSYIWYAPNHLRAFTRDAYDAVGGYDPTRVVLDDQDLMCRLYQHGAFIRIPRVLYAQRSHGGNTQVDPATNASIQTGTVELYDQHVEANALAWAGREGLVCLDLGGAHGLADPRYLRVDQHPGPGVDVVHTFPHQLNGHIVLPRMDAEGTVGVIRAVDFLEHVADKVALINELHRLLAPGGLLLSSTPSTDGRGAFQDPTHVAYYNEHSFWYYTNAEYARYVPELTARFQTSRLVTHHPTPWHAANQVPYVAANLIALKGEGQARNGGILGWP